ncbi:MAG TPA: OmpA family protein [Polyangia bacterium]|nr:OmpA family protein [Polyangia bacterium]
MKTWKTSKSSLFLGLALLGAGCATVPPPVELTTARTSYARASSGPAVQLLPAELHKAKIVLDAAETSFIDEKSSQKTIDLAYIADRTIQTVEVQARTVLSTQTIAKAKQDFQDRQSVAAKKTQASLVKTRLQLSDSQAGQAKEAAQLGAEHAARQDADSKAAASEQRALDSEQRTIAANEKTNAANDALAKLAAKDEERGMVITLSGGVLFRSNDAQLLPAAQTKLDDVAVALLTNGRPVSIEGYTDSKGSQSRNIDLSQRRAESVRTYLISRGLPSDRVVAKGMGPDRPIADNTSAEGRANNRRVEIVVAKIATQPN